MSKVADWIGVGAPLLDVEITEVSSIEAAGPQSVVFAMDKETLIKALESKAGTVLANRSLEDAELPLDPRVLWVGDARYAFAVVGRRLKGRGFEAGVHPSAVVGAGVAVGVGSRIGPGVVLEEGVVVGNDCNLMARVVVHAGTVLGDRIVVQAGAVLGSTGFGYARSRETGEYLIFPQQGKLVVEDDVEIGANTTIDRGAIGDTVVEEGAKLDNQIQVGHNVVVGAHTAIAACTGISGSTTLGKRNMVGGMVGFAGHLAIADDVMITGCSFVSASIREPGSYSSGMPAVPTRAWRRMVAHLRRFGDKEQ